MLKLNRICKIVGCKEDEKKEWIIYLLDFAIVQCAPIQFLFSKDNLQKKSTNPSQCHIETLKNDISIYFMLFLNKPTYLKFFHHSLFEIDETLHTSFLVLFLG